MKKSFPEVLADNPVPLVIGHRGYASRAPENTLPSFQLCLDHKVPAVEFDVHTCGSGELVVIHDDTFARTTGFDGQVRETPLERVRELDAGSWYSEEYKGARIPLLDEVFELMGDRVYYDIEVKWKVSRLSDLERKLVSTIRRHGLSQNCFVTSFNPYSLKEVRRLEPAIALGLLYTNTSNELPRILRRGAGRFICKPDTLNPAQHLVTRRYMYFRHRLAGYPVIPFTVNTPEEVQYLAGLGVSGIISDDPGMVMSVLKEGGEQAL